MGMPTYDDADYGADDPSALRGKGMHNYDEFDAVPCGLTVHEGECVASSLKETWFPISACGLGQDKTYQGVMDQPD